MTLRELLNKLFWDTTEKKDNYKIFFLHRGAALNRKNILFTSITKIHASWFTYLDENGNEILIPFHRVLDIINVKNGKSIWTKRQ